MQLPIAGCHKAWVFPVMGTLPNSLTTFKMWRFAAETLGFGMPHLNHRAGEEEQAV